MLTFIVTLNWTDQGIRSVKEAPKRIQAARERAKKFGVEIKQVFLTSGESDLLVIMETANGDNIAKFALMSGADGKCALAHCARVARGRNDQIDFRASLKIGKSKTSLLGLDPGPRRPGPKF